MLCGGVLEGRICQRSLQPSPLISLNDIIMSNRDKTKAKPNNVARDFCGRVRKKVSLLLGSAVGSGISFQPRWFWETHSLLTLYPGIVLGLTAYTSVKSTHVTSIAYISIIVFQGIGFFLAALIQSPEKISWNDGQAIAIFKSTSWKQELIALPRSILTPNVFLMSLTLFSCQMSMSLTGPLNAFHLNARTRVLVNVSVAWP